MLIANIPFYYTLTGCEKCLPSAVIFIMAHRTKKQERNCGSLLPTLTSAYDSLYTDFEADKSSM